MAVSAKTAAAAKKTSTVDAIGRRVVKKGEPKFANYVEKAMPQRIQEFADWLEEQTGYEGLDARSVYLGSSLRGTFQKSEENQERIAARSAEFVLEKAAKAQQKIDRGIAKAEAKVIRDAARAAAAEAKAEKDAADAAAKAAKASEPKAEKAPAAKKAPAKKAPAAKVAKAAPAAKPAARRRPAKAAAATEDF